MPSCPAREVVRARREEDAGLVELQRVELGGVGRRPATQGHVDLGGHEVHALERVGELEVHVGVGLEEVGEERPDHTAVVGWGGDPQGAGRPVAGADGGPHGILQQGRNAGGVLVEAAPRLGETHAAGGAEEQGEPELLLQPGHPTAHRRAGQAQLPPGRAEALQPNHLGKDRHVVEVVTHAGAAPTH